MTVDTTTINGTIALPNDTNVKGRSTVTFRLTGFDTDGTYDAVIAPREVVAKVSSAGAVSPVALWSNADGVRQTLYDVTLNLYDGVDVPLGKILVPTTGGPYDLNDLLPIAPPAGASVAQYIAELQAAAAEAVDAAAGVAADAADAEAAAAAALVSEGNAAASESAAALSETNAAASETAAATSEGNAATSETNASASESAAATSESNAATSETNAAASESAAAMSEGNAATSAAAAATSASNAETLYDNFDDRYLGAKAADPTVDNDGDPLITGALYFNTTDDTMRVYNGASWQITAVSAADFLQVANDLSDLNDAATARGNLGLGDMATRDGSAVGSLDGAELQEYSENLTTLTGTTPTIDLSLGSVFELTTSGNTTVSISNPSATDASSFTLDITYGGTHTVTYDAAMDFGVAGTPADLASGERRSISGYTIDNGTKYLCSVSWSSA